jgi:hypothetical protein
MTRRKIMEIENGMEITLEELKETGWKESCFFSDCLVMENGKKLIFFDPKKRKIEFVLNT